ncbi:DUF2939 domain-containing protein [Novosphingopyxis sp. YJ-S2-01]|uniref:DUF2939 domain-containing protein n=1 Tax=Novosphingopyxis sp. YJ-S2-01 TaxID=2794021 RepID=UPI0018DB4C82|nr:DUF2939 domain-containing protein [Novosphingopyxis sp. YJ-S2-01]MBH9536913.1 DUF2939 domain-containing protein [Novosphingopyxis sp. YJ-S2-01]
MKKWIFGAAVLAAVLFGAWYFASPSYAMMQLKDAAEDGDADALRDRIDFPAVRESMKAQLSAAMAKKIAEEPSDGFGALGGALAMGMVGPMIDGLVTPEFMAAMIEKGKAERKAGQADPAASTTNAKPVDWTIERNGFDRFRARPEGDESGAALVFTRDGIGWKLVSLDLPADGLSREK